jgi:hypothetical protein
LLATNARASSGLIRLLAAELDRSGTAQVQSPHGGLTVTSRRGPTTQPQSGIARHDPSASEGPYQSPPLATLTLGELYFTSGAGTRKARNLAANPACTISVKLTGVDLVLEGEATRVTDAETLERLAGRYRDGGWPAEVEGDAFTARYSAPSAGPPPWQRYRLALHTAFGVATAEPYGATRWRFR